jgi:UDP-N-acetylglucosamine:LPS N-acetylglucosamine transferase
MLERELTGTSLAKTISELVEDPELLARTGQLAFGLARLDAAQIIVDEMIAGVAV